MIKDMARPAAEPAVSPGDISRISEGTVVRGDMSSTGDIRVDGRVEGKLMSEGRVVVGETATIEGSILCNDLDFWGKIEGDLYVKNLLTLKNTSIVNGNIHVRKIQVEMGSQINGTCRMISEEDFTEALDSVSPSSC